MPSDGVAPRYRLLLQQAERVLDAQLQNLRDEIRRTQTLIHLGMATIGGTIAVAGLIVNVDLDLNDFVVGIFGSGIILVCMGLVYFLAATTSSGGREAPHGGPDILQVLDHVDSDQEYTDEEVFASVAVQHVRSFQRNEQIEADLVRKRARGLLLLVLGVFVELISLTFIVWRDILA